MNGTPASPATALASSVLPVPGGPTSSTPLGIRAPTAVNRRGFLRNSTSSCISSFSSTAPATSAKVMRLPSGSNTRAGLWPKVIILPPPPPCWRIIISQNAIRPTVIMIYGSISSSHGVAGCGR